VVQLYANKSYLQDVYPQDSIDSPQIQNPGKYVYNKPFLELEQFLPAVLSLSPHRPFGTHCRTMSSTRTPYQVLKRDLFLCVMWNVLATERLCIFYYGAIQVLSLYCTVGYIRKNVTLFDIHLRKHALPTN